MPRAYVKKGRPKTRPELFKGMAAGYFAKHAYINRKYPKTICEDCGATENLDLANISGKYLRDRSDYKVLCRSCHKKFDQRKRTYCKRGHPFVEENLYYRKTGTRECRLCVLGLRKLKRSVV